jgi:hypothetical protein
MQLVERNLQVRSLKLMLLARIQLCSYVMRKLFFMSSIRDRPRNTTDSLLNFTFIFNVPSSLLWRVYTSRTITQLTLRLSTLRSSTGSQGKRYSMTCRT